MITKRLIYEPIERIESAISRLDKIAADMEEQTPLSSIPGKIYEIVSRDLHEAKKSLEYVQELAS